MARQIDLADGGSVTKSWNGTSYTWEFFGRRVMMFGGETGGVRLTLTDGERGELVALLLSNHPCPGAPECGHFPVHHRCEATTSGQRCALLRHSPAVAHDRGDGYRWTVSDTDDPAT